MSDVSQSLSASPRQRRLYKCKESKKVEITTFKVGLENQYFKKYQTPLDPHVTFHFDVV